MLWLFCSSVLKGKGTIEVGYYESYAIFDSYSFKKILVLLCFQCPMQIFTAKFRSQPCSGWPSGLTFPHDIFKNLELNVIWHWVNWIRWSEDNVCCHFGYKSNSLSYQCTIDRLPAVRTKKEIVTLLCSLLYFTHCLLATVEEKVIYNALIFFRSHVQRVPICRKG